MRSTIVLGALLAAMPAVAAPDLVADIRAADRTWSAAFEARNLDGSWKVLLDSFNTDLPLQ